MQVLVPIKSLGTDINPELEDLAVHTEERKCDTDKEPEEFDSPEDKPYNFLYDASVPEVNECAVEAPDNCL